MLRLKKEDLKAIEAIAEQSYPHECCGIMVGAVQDGVKEVTRLVSAANQRADSLANRYLIPAEIVSQVERDLIGTGASILGFFHSHPDAPARPSTFDRDHAWPWYSYLIVSVQQGRALEVQNWQLKEDRSAFDAQQLEIVDEQAGNGGTAT
ncbi:MAG: Mov34/MPN/PAD-1 family protein [Acidobacteriota bacterium]